MKFSIVTPVLNGQKYIERTISSVVSQNYKNFEYIIIDGVSSDDTIKIIEKYTHLPFIKVISEKDKGQADALNKGFSLATGDVLFWLNYDDFFVDENILFKINNLFESHNYDFIYGNDILVNEVGEYIKERSFIGMNTMKLVYVNSLSQPTCFFKKNLFERYKLNTDLNYSMDLDLWIHFMQDNSIKMHHANWVVSCNRIHKERKMVKFESKARSEALKVRLAVYGDNKLYYYIKSYYFRLVNFFL
ncbi:glycosyltransferase [Candidatus Methylopumilus universalis]|uniref:glycosyltransferase family 2 protein n=1 Tax=Candidatus Methylopumilus universalis TaxID=2588536 RepID=UPI00111F84CB|nr:glycosyltransferase family 2 protein [Candidatus Methylopumilus universalis]QDC99117.1 glycosyltransferase [Candidatus Methylopumilus universalis]